MRVKQILAALTAFAAIPAMAGELGLFHATYGDRLESQSAGFIIKSGGDPYLWASYENPGIRLVGQAMGEAQMFAVGVGVRHKAVFVEFGYFRPRTWTSEGIRNEAIVTQLNNNHGWHKNRHFETTEYELEGGYGARIGLTGNLTSKLAWGIGYKFLRLEEQIDAFSGVCEWPPGPQCLQWWQEAGTLDFSGAEISISYQF